MTEQPLSKKTGLKVDIRSAALACMMTFCIAGYSMGVAKEDRADRTAEAPVAAAAATSGESLGG